VTMTIALGRRIRQQLHGEAVQLVVARCVGNPRKVLDDLDVVYPPGALHPQLVALAVSHCLETPVVEAVVRAMRDTP